MGFQKPLSLPTKPNELRPNFLNSFGKLGEVKVRAGWHAREDQLGEEHVDIFGRFEGFKPRDFVIELTLSPPKTLLGSPYRHYEVREAGEILFYFLFLFFKIFHF